LSAAHGFEPQKKERRIGCKSSPRYAYRKSQRETVQIPVVGAETSDFDRSVLFMLKVHASGDWAEGLRYPPGNIFQARVYIGNPFAVGLDYPFVSMSLKRVFLNRNDRHSCLILKWSAQFPSCGELLGLSP
jgi:hypothetical protein